MGNEIDTKVAKAQEHLRDILTSIQLNNDEKHFVNTAARRVTELMHDLLEAAEPSRQGQLRGVVLATAIAMVIGPHAAWERGVDTYNP